MIDPYAQMVKEMVAFGPTTDPWGHPVQLLALRFGFNEEQTNNIVATLLTAGLVALRRTMGAKRGDPAIYVWAIPTEADRSDMPVLAP